MTGAVVDVEFDSLDDIPAILDALKIKVQSEKYNAKNDRIRQASLLPKQLREAKARRAKLVEAEKDWISKGSAKKVAAETVAFLKDNGSLDDEALKKLSTMLENKAAGAFFWLLRGGLSLLAAAALHGDLTLPPPTPPLQASAPPSGRWTG